MPNSVLVENGTTLYAVSIGSKWKDRDKREPDRFLTVERIEGEYAYGIATGKTGARPTRVRLDRFGRHWSYIRVD